jgi:hypothetical protein
MSSFEQVGLKLISWRNEVLGTGSDRRRDTRNDWSSGSSLVRPGDQHTSRKRGSAELRCSWRGAGVVQRQALSEISAVELRVIVLAMPCRCSTLRFEFE